MPEYRIRKVSYRCSDCKSQFDKVRKFSVDKYPYGTQLPSPKKDPDCPRCKSAKRVNWKYEVTSDTHPHIDTENRDHQMVGGTPDAPAKSPSAGKSNFTKAMDATADIVMKDYGLTNLQDNLREGDSMAPKLRPDLEQKAQNVFKQQKPIAGQQAASAFNQTLKRQINAGTYKGYGGKNDVVARQQASGIRPQTNILYEHSGKKN